jgi:hypothetical protein
MSEVTNDLLYQTLLDIKGDIGGLKSSSDLHLAALQNHAGRIGTLEGTSERQKGAAKVWALMAAGVSAAASGIVVAAVSHWIKK